jgi:hypothetical protein
VAYALFAFAERDHALSDRGHLLAEGEMGARDDGGIDLPARGGQHPLETSQGAEDPPGADTNQASAARGVDALRLAQGGSGHPAGFGRGACDLAAWRLDPVPVVRQQRHRLLLEAIGQEQWHTGRRSHLSSLMHDTLRHREGALADLERQQPLGDGIESRPDPLRRA